MGALPTKPALPRLNLKSPFLSGMRAIYDFSPRNSLSAVKDIGKNLAGTPTNFTGSNVFNYKDLGMGLEFAGGTDYLAGAGSASYYPTTTTQAAVMFVCRPTVTSTAVTRQIFDLRDATNASLMLCRTGFGSNDQLQFFGKDSNPTTINVTTTNGLFTSNKTHVVIANYRPNGSGILDVYVDGVRSIHDTSGWSTFTWSSNDTTPLKIGGTGSTGFVGTMHMIGFWNRCFSSSEIWELSANPWAMFEKTSPFSLAKAGAAAPAFNQRLASFMPFFS